MGSTAGGKEGVTKVKSNKLQRARVNARQVQLSNLRSPQHGMYHSNAYSQASAVYSPEAKANSAIKAANAAAGVDGAEGGSVKKQLDPTATEYTYGGYGSAGKGTANKVGMIDTGAADKDRDQDGGDDRREGPGSISVEQLKQPQLNYGHEYSQQLPTVFEYHHDNVTAVKWLSDNVFVTCSIDHSLALWDLNH